MKLGIPLAIVCAVGFGCQPPAAQDENPPMVVVQPPPGTPPMKTRDEEKNPQRPKGDNPSRIHQLRDLERGKVKVGGRPLDVYVMNSSSKVQEGMMFLTDAEVKDGEGFLFVFPSVQVNDGSRGFWMENTLIPLDIVYLTESGKVLNIAKGKPLDRTSLPPKGDYQFVIEMKQGQAAKAGLKPGVQVEIPKDLKEVE